MGDNMKGIFIALFILMPFIALAGFLCRKNPIVEESNELISIDKFSSSLGKRLENALIQRLPKENPCIVKRFPMFIHHHRLTDWFEIQIQLPFLEIKTQEEAINVALPYVRAYMDTINNLRDTRPYLFEFPVPLSALDFEIGFAMDPKKNLPLPMPDIAGLFFGRGRFDIVQFTEDKSLQQSPASPYIRIYPTPQQYPEAILKLDHPLFDKREVQVPIPIPENQKYSYFNSSGKSEFRFCQETAHVNDLIFLAFECVFPRVKPGQLRMCSQIAYGAQEKKLTLEEAQALVLKLRDLHIPFYIREKRLSQNVNEARKDGNESLSKTINAQKYFSMRISFWDKYIDRIKPPHIAEVRMYGTNVRYYVSDELQRLQLIHEEELPPYEVEVAVPKELLSELSKEQPKKK